jgi:hypothetical protein
MSFAGPLVRDRGTVALQHRPGLPARQPVGCGNPGVACELEVRSSLGFGALKLFVHVEAPCLSA